MKDEIFVGRTKIKKKGEEELSRSTLRPSAVCSRFLLKRMGALFLLLRRLLVAVKNLWEHLKLSSGAANFLTSDGYLALNRTCI